MKRLIFGLMTLALMASLALATSPVNIKEGRTLDRFFISKTDTASATTEYFGFQAEEGDWYIMEETSANTNTPSFVYAGNSSGFAAAWTNRASLTYEAFSSN